MDAMNYDYGHVPPVPDIEISCLHRVHLNRVLQVPNWNISGDCAFRAATTSARLCLIAQFGHLIMSSGIRVGMPAVAVLAPLLALQTNHQDARIDPTIRSAPTNSC